MDGMDGIPHVPVRPAFYAGSRTWRGDWWTLLHPPYTLWHLSYLVFGACLRAPVHTGYLAGALVSFFFAVGLSAHALDELNGRPLKTGFSDAALWTITIAGLVVSLGLAVAGMIVVTWWLLPLALAGTALMVGYNLELWGGRVHTDAGFALSWGTFPVLVGVVSQAQSVHPSHLCLAVAAYWLSRAQRVLSMRARVLRRRVGTVSGTIHYLGGATEEIDRTMLLEPEERALRWLSWFTVALAAGLFLARAA